MPAASTCVRPPRPWANPRSTCERMTPLLPRAPISDPWAAACITFAAERSSGNRWESSTADRRVRYMFDPVSPSGTGNTLRSLTASWFACSHASAERRPSAIWVPSTSSNGLRTIAAVARRSAASTLCLEMYALDVDVDCDHRKSQRLLDRVLHRAHEVVRDLADPGAVLGDDVELDED